MTTAPLLQQVDIWIDGGGFPAFWYNYGYATALIKGQKCRSVTGYSAGALVASMILCGITVEAVADVALGLVADCGIGSLGDVVFNFCDRLLPDDAHHVLSERVHILTADPRIWYNAKVFSKFDSRKELIDALRASSFIPLFMGFSRSDPVLGCIDGMFARDLNALRSKAHLVITKPDNSTNCCSRYCSNMSVFDKDAALEFYREGIEAASGDFHSTS